MPTPRRSNPKGNSGKQPKTGNALATEQRQLLEQQKQLQQQIEALQRSIDEAPQRRADESRRDRETFLKQSQGSKYRHGAALADARFQQVAPSGKRYGGRPERKALLRAERRAGRLQTLALIIAIIFVVILVASRFL